MSEERWLPVVGAEGEYEVSDLGRVRSLDRTIVDATGTRSRTFQGRLLRPGSSRRDAHLSVTVGRVVGHRYVHSLVLEAFVGKAPARMECRHRDGNPTNNRLGNLAWGSRAANICDKKYHNGPRHAQGKLKAFEVREIRKLLRRGERQVAIARRYDVSQSTVSLIRRGVLHMDVV